MRILSVPAIALILLGMDQAVAQNLPAVTVAEIDGEQTYSLSLQVLVLMTVLTVLPALVLSMTAFTRIVIVLAILRQAIGTVQTPEIPEMTQRQIYSTLMTRTQPMQERMGEVMSLEVALLPC